MQRKKGRRVRGQQRITALRRKGFGFEQLEPRLALAVIIHEFLADNTAGIRDAATHRHDWIELKNTGAVAQDLAGWYLTDSSANLTKFQIPAAGALTVLDPGEMLLVYASGNNGEVGVVSGELHANFQLSLEPGYLGLVQPDGTTIEHEFNLYPQQKSDVSYGTGVTMGTSTIDTLVGSSTAVRVIAPTSEDQARDDNWREIGYGATGWIAGTGGVGFDRNSDGINLAPFINTTLSTGQMANTTSSAYVRYAFNVDAPEQLTSLSLDLRFDDGFIAYLNGREIARANFAEDFQRPQPQWDSFAGNQLGTSSSSGAANRIDEADDLVSFDLTAYLPFLEAGENVFAFHGVNSKSTSGGGTNQQDFLIQPVLTAERATGTSQLGYMVKPSPGRENGIATLGVVGDTHFSVDRGFFDAPFQVAITSTPGASIRYTTDGSAPTETTGTLYSGPINISTTTILRAVAFQTGYASSNVDTQTYIFLDDVIHQDASYVTQPYETWGHDKEDDLNESGYNHDDESDWEMDPDIVAGNETSVKNALTAIPTMSLVMDWDDLFGGDPLPGTFPAGSNVAPSPQGIYIHGSSSERASSLEYFNPNSLTDTFHVDAAVEMQGHSSTLRWNSDKMSFQVKFKAPYGPNELDYNLFGDTPGGENAATTYNTLILDAMYNYAWHHANLSVQADYARFVTDQVTSDLQNAASGIGAPHGKYVHLYVNGLYWGLYNAHERPDEVFNEEYYGGDKDDVYVIKHANNDVNHEYTWAEGGILAEQAYNSLLEAARAVESSPNSLATYQAAASILDVDQFIDYIIVHNYVADGNDWAHNNWYATFNSADPNGKWRFHAWDQEHAFPTTDNGDVWTQFSDITGKDDFEASTEIHQNLMKNEEYRLRFADRVQELLYHGGVLTEAAAQASYEARTNEIDQAIIAESARWGDNRKPTDPYTRADFIAVKNGVLNDFFPVRTNLVLAQFDGAGWIPTLDAPNFNQYGGDITTPFNLTLTNPNGSGTIYYTLDESDPREPGGAFSAAAIEYTGAISLTDSTRVRARVRDTAQSGTANDWSAEVDKTFNKDQPLPLRIVELMYNPAVSGDFEYIELLNIGASTIDLTGVQLADFSAGGFTFAGGTLAAGERMVVAQDVAAFQSQYPAVTNVAATAYSGSLSNGGEIVTLKDAFGVVLQSFTYGDSTVPNWPVTPDGGGPSLEYTGPLNGQEDPFGANDPYENPANWRASPLPTGSPGSDGEVPLLAGDYDLSGTVDDLDYAKWKTDFGTTVVTPGDGADGNSNGRVDAADYTLWRNNLGATNAGSGGGGFASAATPIVEVEGSPESSVFVFDLANLSHESPPAAALEIQPVATAAVGIDHNLILWQLLGHDTAGDGDAPLDDFLSADDAAGGVHPAALWEDDAWVASLGPGT
jgi:hypothetical protein